MERAFTAAKKFVHDTAKAAHEAVVPARSRSAFSARGELTPAEFIAAGDELVAKCPTWSWEGGDKKRDFLPDGKQFLVTRRVPCLQRLSAYEAAAARETQEDADGFALYDAPEGTAGAPSASGAGAGDEEDIPSIDADDGAAAATAQMEALAVSAQQQEEDDDDDDVPDMDDFEEEEDACVAPSPAAAAPGEAEGDNILATRTYDLSICYDKFYAVPRVWLVGYEEDGSPLPPERALEDISGDHAQKTVTVEQHPHLGLACASIHPCKHGAVMKRLSEQLSSAGDEPDVRQYLFIFLKFIAAVVPTVDCASEVTPASRIAVSSSVCSMLSMRSTPRWPPAASAKPASRAVGQHSASSRGHLVRARVPGAIKRGLEAGEASPRAAKRAASLVVTAAACAPGPAQALPSPPPLKPQPSGGGSAFAPYAPLNPSWRSFISQRSDPRLELPQLSSLTPAPLQQPTPSQAQPLFLQCDSPFYLPPLPGLPKPQQAPQAQQQQPDKSTPRAFKSSRLFPSGVILPQASAPSDALTAESVRDQVRPHQAMGFLSNLCGGSNMGSSKGVMSALRAGQKAVTAGHAPPAAAGVQAGGRPADALIASVIGTKDEDTVKATLSLKVPMFARLQPAAQKHVVEAVYVRAVPAGELLIVEGEEGAAADEMYIVKKGEFEVLERRRGVQVRVNTKDPGDCFGEVSLFMRTKRSATVAAVTQSEVFVIQRAAFRRNLRKAVQADTSELELFLNSVPLLKNLTHGERLRLVDALEEKSFNKGELVVKEGDVGDTFYIIKDGEATVFVDSDGSEKTVNQLFRADFFGETSLIRDEPRNATVRAVSDSLEVLMLNRKVFDDVLGPLTSIMEREKSPEVVKKRLVELQKGAQLQVDVKNLQQIRLLGYGAFSAVFLVRDKTTKREYALKRMRKNDVAHCSEHVFCEQAITRSLQHPFIMRQYASFHDESYLYFVFDYVNGGDLMDALILVAEVKQTPRKWHECGDGASDEGVLVGMSEPTAKFYVASLVLALEFVHDSGIVYRDLKPENVLLDSKGYIKLADFGFAKQLGEDGDGRTYTFCGTPGYVAPENILASGYNTSVDWWSLGVLTYVLLTGQQPFGRPSDYAMAIMRRIINPCWEVTFPPYLSKTAIAFINGLLQRKPSQRLGYSALGVSGIKDHPWFAGFNWEQLRARHLDPPIEASRLKKDKARLMGFVDDAVPPLPTAEAIRVFKNF